MQSRKQSRRVLGDKYMEIDCLVTSRKVNVGVLIRELHVLLGSTYTLSYN